MSHKFCNHCKIDHPYTEEFWFKNGGILRKCKAKYKAVTRVEQRLSSFKRSRTQSHCLELRKIVAEFWKEGYDARLEVTVQSIDPSIVTACRADILIPELMLCIEYKTHTVDLGKVKFKYRHWLRLGYQLLVCIRGDYFHIN